MSLSTRNHNTGESALEVNESYHVSYQLLDTCYSYTCIYIVCKLYMGMYAFKTEINLSTFIYLTYLTHMFIHNQ